MAATPIPIIDLSSPYKQALHQEWDSAFRRFGCCILTGHGLSAEELNQMKAEATSFFSQPLENKMLFNFGPYGNERGGYTPQAGEAVSRSTRNTSTSDADSAQSTLPSDPVESFVLNSKNCHHHTNTLPFSGVYFNKCEELVHRLHRLSTGALGIAAPKNEIDYDYFRKYYCASDKDTVGSADPSYALRLAYYPPQQRGLAAESQQEQVDSGDVASRYGAHTDYMGFTILRPDESDWSDDIEGAGGLEVFDNISSCWIPVKLPDHIKKTALIINAGDLIQRWTNDRWTSPLHRVSGPKPHSAAAKQDRTALVFFSGPMADALITVCPACCSEQDTSKYEPVVALDYLMAKLNPTSLDST
jgi:isopenicillin N synthase-like dioxygenase